MLCDLNDAPLLYFSTDDSRCILDVNAAFCKSLEYHREEVTGQKQDVFFTVSTRIFQQTHFFPLLKMQGHAEEIFITLLTKSGKELPVLLNAERKEVQGKMLTLYAGIIVHNRKKFEDELIAAKKATEKALQENTLLIRTKAALQAYTEQLDEQMFTVKRQNEEMRQLNRAVTHELQEPLRKLFLFSNMVMESGENTKSQPMLQKIHDMAVQLRTVVSGLQQFVWLTDAVLQYKQIGLSEMIPLVLSELEKEYPTINIHLTTDELPTIEADEEQMLFLWRELLRNAIRFRKPDQDACIYISCTGIEHNQFKTLPGKYKYVEYWKLDVKDNGIGFDQEHKDKVFELFRRLHTESGRGTGLALCKKIVECHDGFINIESSKDKGATVSIWLPVRKSSLNQPEGNPQHQTKLSDNYV